MKSKSLIIFSLSIGLFIILLYLNSYIKKIKLINMQLKTMNLEQEIKINKLKDVIEYTNSIENKTISEYKIRNIRSDKTCKLSDIYNQYPQGCIIIRIFDIGCSICTDTYFNIISDLPKYNNLVVLIVGKSSRHLKVLSKKYGFKSNVYQINPSELIFTENEINKVLVMHINSGGTILREYHLEEQTLFLLNSIIP